MSDQEIESKTEANSTMQGTATSGYRELFLMLAKAVDMNDVPELWLDEARLLLKEETEKNVLTVEKEVINDGNCVGEVTLRLFDDETVTVHFGKLGRWTPGRLEKAMPRLFHEAMKERARAQRIADGHPVEFNGAFANRSEIDG